MINELINQLVCEMGAQNVRSLRDILDELRTLHRPFLDNLVQIGSEDSHPKSRNLDSHFVILLSAVIQVRLAEQESLTKQEFDELTKNGMDAILSRACLKGDWSSWDAVEKDVDILFGSKFDKHDLIQNGDVPTSVDIELGKHYITIGTPEWDSLTDRRAELILKKNREGLNDDERTEFERLQKTSRSALTRSFPQPKRLSDVMLGLKEGSTGQ